VTAKETGVLALIGFIVAVVGTSLVVRRCSPEPPEIVAPIPSSAASAFVDMGASAAYEEAAAVASVQARAAEVVYEQTKKAAARPVKQRVQQGSVTRAQIAAMFTDAGL
jgi:hypothetical protein